MLGSAMFDDIDSTSAGVKIKLGNGLNTATGHASQY